MQDFEKLGVFYLGKEYDIQQKKLQEELVLLKSKDLTTHAVIIGMTGSGKTGLGVGMIEEAAIDNVPVIAIDPKGDLTNLALTFPQLRGEDFQPWINLQEASNKGVSTQQYAQAQADQWKKGLADWGQDGTRIQTFQNAADVKIYTPGGSAGIGVSVLRSFNAPSEAIINDADAFRDRINITTNSLLSLIGIEGDSFTSRENILIANIFEYAWKAGNDLGLPELILAIQNPPMDKVGVLSLESFYPSKDRFSLAMMLNNLLASPSFQAWLEGEPLNIDNFLYNDSGKARVSVFSIAHLSDSERMFFVTMLLNEVLSWARSQSGTGSLRAMLYMDELFGYLPPVANPPSKLPLLTLLKQARAFGLGLVLSTQNPVDLDYKALSNAGTWFIGRLQTERDKERVMAGLEGASVGANFDKAKTEKILAGLGKRVFYLHSVHEDKPVIFSTRWVMSYLAGPLTRDQIINLPKATITSNDQRVNRAQSSLNDQSSQVPQIKSTNSMAPVLPPQIQQVYVPITAGSIQSLVYTPSIICIADILYKSVKHNVVLNRNYTMLTPLHDGPMPVDYSEGQNIDLNIRDLENQGLEGVAYANYPNVISDPKKYDDWKKLFNQYARLNLSVDLLYSPTLKVVSEIDEDERDFRIRLQHVAHEVRDEAMANMKKKYASKLNTLEDRHRRALQAVEKQSSLAGQRKMDAALSAGGAILGALFGRKITATSVSRVSTAVSRTSRALSSGQGIDAAKQTLDSVKQQLSEMEVMLENELAKISETYDMLNEKLETITLRAKSTDITVHLLALAWNPITR